MAYWTDTQLEQILPPQTRDDRGRAVIAILDKHFADQPVSQFLARAAETCPTEALPALIAELSLEEFIAPGLPEKAVRAIISRAWPLHAAKGYDAGVMLGLSLLGMTASIQHWYEQEPPGAPHTHIIRFEVEEQLYPGEEGQFGERQMAAAIRMINATKRWSQDSEIRAGLRLKGKTYLGTRLTGRIRARLPAHIPVAPPASSGPFMAVAVTARIRTTLPALT